MKSINMSNKYLNNLSKKDLVKIIRNAEQNLIDEFLYLFGSIRSLNKACTRGHIDMVKRLLKDKRVDPSEPFEEFEYLPEYPITIACRYGYYDIVNLLLKDDRVDPSVMNSWALSNACRGGYYNIVKLLLQYDKVDPRDHMTMYDPPIIIAKNYGHESIVKLLLQYNCQFD